MHRVLIASFVLLWASSGRAGVLRVPEDFASVLAAVDAAASGDSVLIAPGTWSERETRTVSINGFSNGRRSSAFLKSNVTLIGTAGAAMTVLQGDPEAPSVGNDILTYPDSPGGVVRIVGLTLRGAGTRYSGLLGTGSGTVILNDCVIEGNGQGVDVNRANLSMFDTTVRNQDGSLIGISGIKATSVDLVLDGCTFESNTGGRVVFCQDVGGNSRATVQSCRFVDNEGGKVLFLNGQDPVVVQDNWFEGNIVPGNITGFCLTVAGSKGSVERNTFVNNEQFDAGAGVLAVIGSADLGSVNIVSNTISGTLTPPGSAAAGVVLLSSSAHEFYSNIVAGCRGGPAVFLGSGQFNPTDGCNVLWDNDSGNFDTYTPQPTDVTADPQFCNAAAGDFTVSSQSPCVAGGVPGCGLIGAWDVGCGGVSVEPASWGRIKGMYR
ncbi:MAG: hypothetical protein DHS20C21_06490 [Gemmatimonadota bacterium]|nr:MAG: hypothetical protein DHS20C21_06490 [Gemmatimonadota bacterium]